MNSYGQSAVHAVRAYAALSESPQDAWNRATSDIFGVNTSSQRKGCPRNAFLGLCEEGLVRGFRSIYPFRHEQEIRYRGCRSLEATARARR